MPREITKYLCDHKCGHRAMSKKADMEAHEKRCWKNPALKTCRSCKHHLHTKADPFDGWPATDECLNREANGILEEHMTKQDDAANEQYFIRLKEWEEDDIFKEFMEKPEPTEIENYHPVINCPFWEGKNT